jgi:hypothetical protein
MMMKPTHAAKRTTISGLRKIMVKEVICGRDQIADQK